MVKYDINLQGVSLQYGNSKALDAISCSISAGKIYGLIGRNGAGKTSLLSLLGCFKVPTSGKIRVAGEEPFENREIMQQINFVYDADYSEEGDTASDYLQFASRYRPNFDMAYAQELARLFKLPLKKPIKKLSRGMQSAMNVILGLASRCPITIFDEVYFGMDAPSREIFYQQLLDDQERSPRTMILSTHLVTEMEYLFDHVLVLDQGRLVVDGAIDNVLSQGVSITGPSERVDSFVHGMSRLKTDKLGGTKSVMVYGEITDTVRLSAEEQGLEVGNVSLQELFIHLTKEETSDEHK